MTTKTPKAPKTQRPRAKKSSSPSAPANSAEALFGSSQAPPDDCRPLCVARVGRAHGLRGDFHARGATDEAGSSLWHVERLWLRPPKTSESKPATAAPWYPASIRNRRGGNVPIMALNGVNGRDQARSILHWELWVLREDLPELKEDEFYMADLVGLDVLDADGKLIGRVDGIWDGVAHDNIVMLDTEGLELQIPFVEAHVAEVDLVEGFVKLTRRPIRA